MIELSAPQHILKGHIRLSGSKSISNRLLILSKVLHAPVTLENSSDAEDTLLLKKALEEIENKTSAIIDIHHAGTDMRFLTAYLAVTEGKWTLTGSARMKQRPIGELVNALKNLGAEITYLEKENFPPLLITGNKLEGGSVEMDSSVSSQFVSALLLIAPSFKNGLELNLKGQTVSKPYIDMTLALLRSAGVSIEQKENVIKVLPFPLFPLPSSLLHFPPDSYPDSISIESDWSSASYWYSICALAAGSEIELSRLQVKSLQADSILPEVYAHLGVKTTVKENSVVLDSAKPVLREFTYDFTHCPDIAQTVAVTCLGLGIKARLTGLSTLKVKETDRIAALKTELEKFGARVIAGDSTLEISPPSPADSKIKVNSLLIHTYNDHRMAMSFAPLALIYGSIKIDEAAVVLKSYPSFWEDLKSVGFNVNLQP